MTGFQREIAVVIVLLSFLLGYSVYVETVHIGMAGRGLTVQERKKVTNASEASASFEDCVCF